MTYMTKICGLGAVAAMLVLAGCKDLDVQNLNGANASTLQESPTPALLVVAAQSLVTGSWRAVDADHASSLTRYGYEVWQFRASEPRGLTNVVSSPITGGSWSFGTIKNINLILDALTKIGPPPDGMSDAAKAGMRAWLNWNLAIQLEDMAQAHDSFGVALTLQVDPLSNDPAPINSKAEVWAKIFQLSDSAFNELGAAGNALPIRISAGFAGYSTPTQLRTVIRGLQARWRTIYAIPLGRPGYNVADWDAVLTALTGSFINPSDVNSATVNAGMTAAQMRAGPYHVYEATSTNGLNTTDRFVNSRVAVEAQCKTAVFPGASCSGDTVTTTTNAAGTTSINYTPTNRDGRVYGTNARFQSVPAYLNLFDVTSNFRSADFLNPVQSARIGTQAPLPALRNEELLLLRAEAYINKNDCVTAIKDLNRVRQSLIANLPAITCPYVGNATLNQPLSLEDALLYEKRFSLWGETGTVWVDMRHYGKARLIPHWLPEFRIFDIFPIPNAECDIRTKMYTEPVKGCFQGGYPGIQGGPNTKFQPLQ